MYIIDRLLRAEKYFGDSSYEHIVREAKIKYHNDCFAECENILDKFPTEKQLLEKLMNKLKGKSVYTTLKGIQEGKIKDNYTKLKGLSSMLTHVIIETKVNPEYKILIPFVVNKINELSYHI